MESQNKMIASLPQPTESLTVFGSKSNFEEGMRMAKCLSSSTIVPSNYRGEANLANCVVALEMANRIGASPLMVMQNLYIVNGNPGWSAKFLIAALNSSGRFSPLRYEFKGDEGTDEWGCRAHTTDHTGEKLYGAWVTIKMAKDEGWYGKAGSKWKTMPQLMLQYRAAAFFQRTYAPEISMGMHTDDELRDIAVDVPYEDVSDKVESEIANNANKTVIGFSKPESESESVTQSVIQPQGTPEQQPKSKSKPKRNLPF
jgi:hypothetical protein